MLKIGDFSKLSQVPIKTLRYYDRIGLLKPAEVDRFTGYRYYSISQMPRLNRILALKDLGFSLEQIARMLDDGLSLDQLRGMLMMKQAEVETLIADERARLARIQARLNQIERENTMPDYEIVIKKAEPLRAATLRDTVADYMSVGPLYEELMGVIQQAGLHPAGPGAAIYYDEEYKESDVDVEVYFPIEGDLPPHDRVKVRTIEGAEHMASLVRTGAYDDFTPAYQAIMEWVTDNGYAICGPNREIYLRSVEAGVPPEEYVVEIQFPVRKAE